MRKIRNKQQWGNYNDISKYNYYIYMIEYINYIKIGCTYDILQRLSTLNIKDNKLLCCIEICNRYEAFKLENNIHKNLINYRYKYREYYIKDAYVYNYMYKLYLSYKND